MKQKRLWNSSGNRPFHLVLRLVINRNQYFERDLKILVTVAKLRQNRNTALIDAETENKLSILMGKNLLISYAKVWPAQKILSNYGEFGVYGFWFR